MPQIIAVDLGGTHIRAAFYPTPQPPPASQTKSPTKASEGPEAVISRIIDAIQEQIPTEVDDLRIGIGAPGPLDPINGVIIEAPNLPDWSNVPLRDRLSQSFQCPIVLGNDANLAALGEFSFGAGTGSSNMIYLTISTGIGGGVIINNRLLLGANGLAAELGHMTVDPEGPLCGCGQYGHIEAVAAGPAIANHATKLIESGHPSILAEKVSAKGEITAMDVGEASKVDDNVACTVLAEAGKNIGRHMASLAHAFNPEVFVLGGGVSQIGSYFFQAIEGALHDHVMHPAYLRDLRVVPATLGDDAGLTGAMVLADQA